MDRNRELHRLLGHCVHENLTIVVNTKYKYREAFFCPDCGHRVREPIIRDYPTQPSLSFPDYTSDPRLVLREMKKRDDFQLFLTYVFDSEIGDERIDNLIISGQTLVKFLDLTLDTTGKLADLASKWLKEDRAKTQKAIKRLLDHANTLRW